MALCGENVGPLCGGEKDLTLFNDFLFTFCTNDIDCDNGDDDTTESSETLKFSKTHTHLHAKTLSAHHAPQCV